MNYFLGVDIGTTSAKAVAFSESAEVIASHSVSYDMIHPQPSWSELDPDEILHAVIEGINTVVEQLLPAHPACISFSAAMHSLMAVNERGGLLTKCIIWADNRADEIAEDLRKTDEGKRIYQVTGVPIHSMSPLCKLLWFKQNDADIFNSAYKFIGIKEYIFYKLFAVFEVDTSIASATGLLNTKTLSWDEEVLSFVGLATSKLSEVVPVKKVYYYNWTFKDSAINDVPVVIGASDGALSNLGAGATSGGSMAVTIGTSGAARLVLPEPAVDSAMRTFCYHLKDHFYIAGGGNNNGAVVLQWLKETLLVTDDTFENMFEQAETISAGSNGLVFLPYLLGERAPIWNSNAKGVYFGLGIQHTKAHIIRASLEGVILSIYSVIKVLAEKTNITEIHASGGFAKSALWLQILADVTNIKVLVSNTVESSALGAVLIGAEALGINIQLQKRSLDSYEPNKENYKVYQHVSAKFERLYNLLKDEMVKQE